MTTENKTVRTLTGRIVSDKMDKTVTVLVERRVAHPVIGKVVRRSKKFHAHCDNGVYKAGDVVTIQECRPISKTKSWKVTALIEKSREI
jgi:small subunit ribosomal protein S17